jgi:hypothetical protein
MNISVDQEQEICHWELLVLASRVASFASVDQEQEICHWELLGLA